MSEGVPAEGVTPAGLYDRPVLVVDPGAHTGIIMRADVDAAGRFAVTAAQDKTVRVWSLQDGVLLRTIRLPAGPGNVGKAFAVAIDPAGELIAVGGWMRWTDADPQEQIYLLDRASGELVERIEGLSSQVTGLRFAPDGLHLAVVLTVGGLRVFGRRESWAEVGRDDSYDGQSYCCEFSVDGNIVTTAYDGHVRSYDKLYRLIKDQIAPHGDRPRGVAINPASGQLATAIMTYRN